MHLQIISTEKSPLPVALLNVYRVTMVNVKMQCVGRSRWSKIKIKWAYVFLLTLIFLVRMFWKCNFSVIYIFTIVIFFNSKGDDDDDIHNKSVLTSLCVILILLLNVWFMWIELKKSWFQFYIYSTGIQI